MLANVWQKLILICWQMAEYLVTHSFQHPSIFSKGKKLPEAARLLGFHFERIAHDWGLGN